ATTTSLKEGKKKMRHYHGVHGVKVCPKTFCRIVWNHDLNADLNFLQIFLAMKEG
ncbi:1270_t:CDS:1, partial [Entrophospora sp. SA101]